jgi:hypothetical protein
VRQCDLSHSRDVVKNAMNLTVHLVQSLLHVQDVLGCHLNQAAAMSPEGPYGADESGWPEAGAQQTHRTQILKPLAIRDVCLPARHVLHVLCVD